MGVCFKVFVICSSWLIKISEFFFLLLINQALAVLDLCSCARAFSSCGEQGLLLAVHRRLIAVASLVAERRL